MDKQIVRVGIAGNPNSGKTTIFNELTGSNLKVGNYPGVTVEKKEGTKKYGRYIFKLYDLPGTYSLTSYSLDELVARDFILNEKPDIIINVMDSTNLERHLYLAMQIQEFGVPLVGVLNMTDEAEEKGIEIDASRLGELLGIEMVKTVGKKGAGLNLVLDAIIKTYENKENYQGKRIDYGKVINPYVEKLENLIQTEHIDEDVYPPRWLAVKLLEKDKEVSKRLAQHPKRKEIEIAVADIIKNHENLYQRDMEIMMTEMRYGYIHGALTETVKAKPRNDFSFTEMIDKILLNKVMGLPIFLFIMWVIFQVTFTLGEYPMGWLESGFSALAKIVDAGLPDGLIKSLLVDGIIGGVGGILEFLPNVLILFAFLSFLEDTGYMSRIAFITDKFMHKFGLHGQSFIPFITGFGCSIPAIMSARTLKNDKDRLITIQVVSFFSCGARLPVYTLLISAFFKDSASGNILFLVYLIGVIIALLSALLFRHTLAKGEVSPFVMELPPYRMPSAKSVVWHVGEKAWFYIRKAGTLILAASIIVWAMMTFPSLEFQESQYAGLIEESFAQAFEEGLSEEEALDFVDAQVANVFHHDALEYSIAGRLGRMIEPVIKPIGFDWKIGISLISGFAAKEIVVSTLGVLYKVGEDVDETSASFRNALRSDAHFNPLVAFVLMLFVLIYVPCLATLAVIKQELGKWRWVFFNVAYTTGLAWIVSFVVYNVGRLML